MSSTLERLVSKSRPLKPFTVEIGGETFSLQVRKASAIESSAMSEAWETAYQETIAKEEAGDKTGPLYASFRGQPKEKLAEFVSKANYRELRSEALLTLGDKPSAKKVEEAVEKLRLEMVQSLVEMHDEVGLWEMACERQRHFYALSVASEATNKAMTRAIVYDEEGNKMFANGEEEELSSEDIKKITDAAVAALDG